MTLFTSCCVNALESVSERVREELEESQARVERGRMRSSLQNVAPVTNETSRPSRLVAMHDQSNVHADVA